MALDLLTHNVAAGGTRKVSPERLDRLKSGAEALATEVNTYGNEDGTVAHNTRFAKWAGQSSDGRQWAENMPAGKKPRPFNGAPDTRVRLADELIRLNIATCLEAMRRAELQVDGLEPNDDQLAARLSRLHRFVTKNRLGRTLPMEVERMLNWQFGDQPGVAVMGVYWHTETSLRMTTLRLADLLAEVMPAPAEDQLGPDRAQVEEFLAIFQNPARLPEAARILMDRKPHLTEARARQMAQALGETGETEYPEPYTSKNQVCLKAHRYNDDFFVPRNTTDLAKARLRIVRQMMTATELEDGIVRYGFRKEFVRAMLGTRKEDEQEEGPHGQTLFRLNMAEPHENATGDATNGNPADVADGLYEVLFAYYPATNQDGVSALYVTAFNFYCDEPATDEQIVPYDPHIWFSCEFLSRYLVESRGIPELVATDQSLKKMFQDSFAAAAQMRAVPPMEVAQDRPNTDVIIAPLAKNKVTRPGDIKFMEMPDYPREVVDMMKMLFVDTCRYHGMAHAEVPEILTQLLSQDMVNRFLGGMQEVHRLILKVCQLYMPDEEVQRVLGADAKPLAQSWQDIQGDYDAVMEFDSRELNLDYMVKLGEIVSKVILPMDTDASVKRTKLVNRFMRKLSPVLAEETVDAQETANAREIEDEENALVKILNGIEPPRKPGNHALRLQVIDQTFARNPEMEANLKPTSRAILDARVKFHAQQVDQEKNKQIGREGSPRVLDRAGANPASFAQEA